MPVMAMESVPIEGVTLARQSTKEAPGQFKKKRPELAFFLGNYDINRQLILACQQSGGGSRMAPSFACVMSISCRCP
jgi:hypothetical protein